MISRSLWKPIAAALLGVAACGAQDLSEGVQATWGLHILASIAGDQRNVTLLILDCKLEGFRHDIDSPYRASSAVRSDPGGKITATVRTPGIFYPAFIFYDGEGEEHIGISINGARRGVAVANVNNNRQYMFFLTTPVTFRGGETIELTALTTQGRYRTEDLFLLREKPQPRQHTYTITELEARAEPSGSRASAEITWITNWPVKCTLEWREAKGGAAAKAVEELAMNNHRMWIRDLKPRDGYRLRVSGLTRDGKLVESEWKTFNTAPPRPFAGVVARSSMRLVAAPAAPGSTGQVPAAVRATLPVTTGVPFPMGRIGSENRLRLVDAGGKEVPLQAQTLLRWPDGSLKWVLLDFQTTGLGQTPYTLEFGSQVSRKVGDSRLKVEDTPAGISVETGPLKFVVSRRRLGFVESLALDSNGDGKFGEAEQIITPKQPASFRLTGPDGTVYTTDAPPDELVLEEKGPLRAVVRASGRHAAAGGRKFFAYTIRFHAYAGQPYLRVQHTFGNDYGESEFVSIKSLALHLPLARANAGETRWALGSEPNLSGALNGNDSVRLRQHRDDRYTVTTAQERALAEGKRSAGWAEWSDGARSVTVAVRDFWQNYPKDVVIGPDGMELFLCPPVRADEYESFKGTVDEYRQYFYLMEGAYKLRQGVQKTHDIWLDFSGAARPSIIRHHRAPLFASAPATWYADSKALGEIAPVRPGGILAQYDAAFAKSFEGYLQNREINHEFGMLNFGDWWGERQVNWGNSEYDTQHALILQFTRTGDSRYLRAAEEMEWHNRDIDFVHHNTDPIKVGGNWMHAIGHTGNYFTENPFKRGYINGYMAAPSHTFLEGHLDYYFLTGDRLSLETARSTADRYASYQMTNYDYNNSRDSGWHLILEVAMYNATYDRFYHNAARMIVDRVLERQTPDGGWRRQLAADHCLCIPRHHGSVGFMVAVLLSGMRNYYQATGDERVVNSIVRAAHFLIDDMWVPEARGFRYTSCPKSKVGPWSNFLLFDGIAFAHRRTNDPKLGKVLLDGTGSAIEGMAGWGKDFTMYTRVAPHFLGHLADLQENRPATTRSPDF